jgi:hypothetical protein
LLAKRTPSIVVGTAPYLLRLTVVALVAASNG